MVFSCYYKRTQFFLNNVFADIKLSAAFIFYEALIPREFIYT